MSKPSCVNSQPSLKVSTILVAGGIGKRMGGMDKIMFPLMGSPLLSHSLQVFNDCSLIDAIVVVMSAKNIDVGRRLVEESGWNKVTEVCVGGDLRQNSVRNGLNRIKNSKWTIVHDGARPCITEDLIIQGLFEVKETGAAVAALPVKNTIKVVSPELKVNRTLTRDGLWEIQTPQFFETETLLNAHQDITDVVTDDATMVELNGGSVKVFWGSHENIKITDTTDLNLAEAILRRRIG